jgi:hypothetical protein
MDRCTRCVLPTGYPGLRFDEAGTCEFCRRAEAEPPWSQTLAKRASELEAIVARIRQDAMGASYDCVVPISGGKDSSYVLYYARRVLGLRVLALNFHNGLQAEAAHHNLEILCVDLDVPLVTLRPSTSLMRRMYARFLRETGEFCSVCNGIGYFLILSFGLREATRTRRTIHGFGGWSARYDAEPGVYSFDTSYLEQVLGNPSASNS